MRRRKIPSPERDGLNDNWLGYSLLSCLGHEINHLQYIIMSSWIRVEWTTSLHASPWRREHYRGAHAAVYSQRTRKTLRSPCKRTYAVRTTRCATATCNYIFMELSRMRVCVYCNCISHGYFTTMSSSSSRRKPRDNIPRRRVPSLFFFFFFIIFCLIITT